MQTHRSILIIASLAACVLQARADTTLIVENFGGGTEDLNGTSADTFDAAIVTAGGSGTWVAEPSEFDANGDVLSSGGDGAAYLSLGSYINATKGTAAGKFRLTATLTKPTSSSWVSLGFFLNPTATSSSFIASPPGGLATVIYRVGSTRGLQPFPGPGSTVYLTEVTSLTTPQVATIELDLTPLGGYNGTSNHGTVRYYRGTSPEVSMGSYLFTSSRSFLGLGVTKTGTAGNVDNLTLTQIVPAAPVGALAEVRHGLTDIAVGATNDLGNVAVGGTLSRIYTVANNPAAGANLYLTGSPAVVFAENGSTSYGGFTITTNVTGSATNLAAGASTTFALQYDATQGVARHYATVSIANTHAAKNPYTFKVVAGTYALATLPVLVTEDFTGGTEDLHGSCAETFSAAILAMNGSPTWVAKTGVFRANGTVTNGNQMTASISLGESVEATKGTAAGKFWLAATLEKPLGDINTWVSIGFCGTAVPSVDSYFVGNGSYGTMMYRGNGEIDAYGGGGAVGTDNNVQGSVGLSGPKTLTIQLDLTPSGGYDGTTNFGTVTFFQGTAEPGNSIGSYTYTTQRNFRSLTICTAAAANVRGQVDTLSLTTLPPPAPLGTVMLLR
jgi:hypothetical protein